jgi:hypothetical protein
MSLIMTPLPIVSLPETVRHFQNEINAAYEQLLVAIAKIPITQNIKIPHSWTHQKDIITFKIEELSKCLNY